MPKSYSPEFRRRVIELCWAVVVGRERLPRSSASLKQRFTGGSPRRKSTSVSGQAFAAASVLSSLRPGRGSRSWKPNWS